jgi:hypothetical protein
MEIYFIAIPTAEINDYASALLLVLQQVLKMSLTNHLLVAFYFKDTNINVKL